MLLFQSRRNAPLVCLLAILLANSQAFGQCFGRPSTLAEDYAGADAVVLLKVVCDTKSISQFVPPIRQFKIVEIAKRPVDSKVEIGDVFTRVKNDTGMAGDLFLMMGDLVEPVVDEPDSEDADEESSDDSSQPEMPPSIQWQTPLKITREGFDYIRRAPVPGLPDEVRLPYFKSYLEHPDDVVAVDAYLEFSEFDEDQQIAARIPADRLRKWLNSSDGAGTYRHGLYARLLAYEGTTNDARMLRDRILKTDSEFRPELDGLMIGYVLLSGEAALAVLDQNKIQNKDEPFQEAYAFVQAINYLWKHKECDIEPERLRESMRLMLDRPEMADLIIANLSIMQDWSIQERLLEMYQDSTYDVPSIKRAIVRYTLTASVRATPVQAARSEQCLSDLRRLDPKTYEDARRFFAILRK